MPESVPSVVVVGSVNLDVVAELDHLPAAGETIIAKDLRRNVGGKGANQAVAARIAGAAVEFVGRVGDDPSGALLRSGLGEYDVSTHHVRTIADTESGVAYINVADSDNTIVVAAGANWSWNGLGDDEQQAIARADVIVCQMEVPDAVIAWAARTARSRFVLNAAPARAVGDELLGRCDPLVVNEHELAVVSGHVIRAEADVVAAHLSLTGRGAQSVVTTMGPRGAIWTRGGESGRQPAPSVAVRDTTGAGDVFVGHLVAQLASGSSMADAVAAATAAGSLSVQRPGTHASYPTAASTADATVTLPPARPIDHQEGS